MVVIALADGLCPPPPEGMLDALTDPLAGQILRTAALAALLAVPCFVVSRLKLKGSTLSLAVKYTFTLICLGICLYLSTFLYTPKWRGPSRYDGVNYPFTALERTPGHFSPVFGYLALRTLKVPITYGACGAMLIYGFFLLILTTGY